MFTPNEPTRSMPSRMQMTKVFVLLPFLHACSFSPYKSTGEIKDPTPGIPKFTNLQTIGSGKTAKQRSHEGPLFQIYCEVANLKQASLLIFQHFVAPQLRCGTLECDHICGGAHPKFNRCCNCSCDFGVDLARNFCHCKSSSDTKLWPIMIWLGWLHAIQLCIPVIWFCPCFVLIHVTVCVYMIYIYMCVCIHHSLSTGSTCVCYVQSGCRS